MTAKRAVTDEQLGRFARRTRELQDRLEKGTVPYDPAMSALQDLLQLESARPRVQGEDLLKAYQKIRGRFFLFFGPAEWERACLGPKEENPLDLERGWCHKLLAENPLVIPRPIEVIKRVVAYCRTPEWNTRHTIWLMVPEIPSPKGKIRTNLLNQNFLWGAPHDDIGPGLVRQDVFWSNWFVSQNEKGKMARYELADEPACDELDWGYGYEFAAWTAKKIWVDQQAAISQRQGLSTVTAPRDALMLNLARANGRELRLAGCCRTETIFDGHPLDVSSRPNGVFVRQYWNPEDAYEGIAASVQGVWEL